MSDDGKAALPSRRAVLGAGAGVAALGAAAPAAPAVARGAVAGRRFKALLAEPRRAGEPQAFKPPRLAEARLLPLADRGVLVRVEASAPCYSSVGDILPTPPRAPAPAFPAAAGFGANLRDQPPIRPPANAYSVSNHAYVGVVEAVGPLVKRVAPGERVIVGVTSHCGQCYQCLTGSPEMCQFMTAAFEERASPFATADDGRPVVAALAVGGFSELSVVVEEYCYPVVTEVPPVELSLLGDQLASGLAATMSKMQVQAGSDVVIFGAGPVGLGAVQGARLRGAGQIIVVEPVKMRRDMAEKFGATTVLDPHAEGDELVPRIHALCRTPTQNRFAGGELNSSAGADYAIGTVGAEWALPKVERSPDPTGLLPMQQTWSSTRLGGHVCWMGLVAGAFSIPASQLCFAGGKTVWPGQQAGLQSFRDLPRFVKLMERGLIDARSMVEGVYPLDRTVEAAQEILDRTKVATVVTPNG